jgi:hypothetical protein
MDEFYDQLERYMTNFSQGLDGYMEELRETSTALEMEE